MTPHDELRIVCGPRPSVIYLQKPEDVTTARAPTFPPPGWLQHVQHLLLHVTRLTGESSSPLPLTPETQAAALSSLTQKEGGKFFFQATDLKRMSRYEYIKGDTVVQWLILSPSKNWIVQCGVRPVSARVLSTNPRNRSLNWP